MLTAHAKKDIRSQSLWIVGESIKHLPATNLAESAFGSEKVHLGLLYNKWERKSENCVQEKECIKHLKSSLRKFGDFNVCFQKVYDVKY